MKKRYDNDPDEEEDETDDSEEEETDDSEEENEEITKPIKRKAKGLRTQWQQAQDNLAQEVDDLKNELAALKKTKIAPPAETVKLPEVFTPQALQTILENQTKAFEKVIAPLLPKVETNDTENEDDHPAVKTSPKNKAKPFMYRKR